MLFDTHSHIQFKVFDGTRDQVIEAARKSGVEKIIAVGTDLFSSREAINVANKYPEVFASIGIHPHHIFEIAASAKPPRNDVIARSRSDEAISLLELLLNNPKAIAVGETGIDRHVYTKTKYKNYRISDNFIKIQKEFFEKQIQLAIKYNKTLIIHNREAVEETLEILEKNWDKKLSGSSVFHFCEPDKRLLDFAKEKNIYIGVDADILTDTKKQEFVKLIPLKLLVLETDSPFISPTPAGILEIAEFICKLLNNKNVKQITYQNSVSLFKL